MIDEPTNARRSFGDIAPKLAEITDKVLFGDVCEDEALSPRDQAHRVLRWLAERNDSDHGCAGSV